LQKERRILDLLLVLKRKTDRRTGKVLPLQKVCREKNGDILTLLILESTL
jgi:hypothetical protein